MQLSKTIDYKMIIFLEIIKKKSISLKLRLTYIIKIYNVFYSNFLQKFWSNLLLEQVKKLALPVIIDKKEK